MPNEHFHCVSRRFEPVFFGQMALEYCLIV